MLPPSDSNFNGQVNFQPKENNEFQSSPSFKKSSRQHFLSKKYLFLGLGSFVVIVVGLLVGLKVMSQSQELRKAASSKDLYGKAYEIQIISDKEIYDPGDMVKLTIQADDKVKDIKVNWAPVGRNIIQKPFISEEVLGQYNPNTNTWTGNWIVPKNGEYLLMANIWDQDDILCAGNPGYGCDDCGQGTLVKQGVEAGQIACNGTNKILIVDSHSTQQLTRTGEDMKLYFNLHPGNRWLYEGENQNCGLSNQGTETCQGEAGKFQTLMIVEEKAELCGHIFTPLRITKSNVNGYILANNPLNYRIFFSNFESGERWSENYIGKGVSKLYKFAGNNNALSNLGKEIYAGDEYFQGGNLYLSDDSSRNFENQYYAPHTFTPRYIDFNWQYEKIDKLIPYSKQDLESCAWDYVSRRDILERYGHNSLHEDYVETPAYSGPVIRLSMYEGRYPLGTGWFLREDWYFAKNIGRVQIDWKRFNRPCLGKATDDPNCDKQQPMQNPDVRLKLNSYYTGEKLKIRVNAAQEQSEYEADRNGINTLYAETDSGQPYTGYLEAKTCISETNCQPGPPFVWQLAGERIWVQEGIAQYDLGLVADHELGLRHSYFRPLVPKSPTDSKGEKNKEKTELPWSDEVKIRVGEVSEITSTQTPPLSDHRATRGANPENLVPSPSLTPPILSPTNEAATPMPTHANTMIVSPTELPESEPTRIQVQIREIDGQEVEVVEEDGKVKVRFLNRDIINWLQSLFSRWF